MVGDESVTVPYRRVGGMLRSIGAGLRGGVPTTKESVASVVLSSLKVNRGSTLTMALNGRCSMFKFSVGARPPPIKIGEDLWRSTSSSTSSERIFALEVEMLDLLRLRSSRDRIEPPGKRGKLLFAAGDGDNEFSADCGNGDDERRL